MKEIKKLLLLALLPMTVVACSLGEKTNSAFRPLANSAYKPYYRGQKVDKILKTSCNLATSRCSVDLQQAGKTHRVEKQLVQWK